jgi:hypothetical protein
VPYAPNDKREFMLIAPLYKCAKVHVNFNPRSGAVFFEIRFEGGKRIRKRRSLNGNFE